MSLSKVLASFLLLLVVSYSNVASARYLQSDPIGLEGGINTYQYANDNPNSYTDPTGLVSNPAEGACVLGPNPVCIGGVVVDVLTNAAALAAAAAAANEAAKAAKDYCEPDKKDCYEECKHLLPSPSGDLQSSEYRKCYRKCKGTLSD